MTSEEELKQHADIQFCINLDKTPVQAMELLNRATGKSTVVRSLVYKDKRYSKGRETIMDDGRCGHPVSKSRKCDV